MRDKRIEGARLLAKKTSKKRTKDVTQDVATDDTLSAVEEGATEILEAESAELAGDDAPDTSVDTSDDSTEGTPVAVESDGEDIAISETDDAIDSIAADLNNAEPSPRTSGLLPTVLGGAIAAGLGIAGMYFYQGTQSSGVSDQVAQLQQTIADQALQIDDLTGRLDSLSEIDITPLENGVTDTQTQIEAVTDQIATLESQVAEILARPAAEDTGEVTVDLSGVNAQIAELTASLDVQKGELAQMIAKAQSEKADAEEIARQTMARAAVTRILVALDSGAPFADALADVEANSDAPLSEALAQTASEGVPTIAALAEGYPDAARAALAAARSDAPASGVGSFLSKQLGVRSVAPREGDDPDAVLSRMEAAVKEGRLADALAEMEALPDAAKAPLAAWADLANLRLTATGDAEALANSLNSQ